MIIILCYLLEFLFRYVCNVEEFDITLYIFPHSSCGEILNQSTSVMHLKFIHKSIFSQNYIYNPVFPLLNLPNQQSCVQTRHLVISIHVMILTFPSHVLFDLSPSAQRSHFQRGGVCNLPRPSQSVSATSSNGEESSLPSVSPAPPLTPNHTQHISNNNSHIYSFFLFHVWT